MPRESNGFTNRSTQASGAEKVYDDVIAELRKQNSITVVADESNADVILGGGGEIWVRGYRSLNPRSGRLPSDGTPVYDGYLSVELRRQKKARRCGLIRDTRRWFQCLKGPCETDRPIICVRAARRRYPARTEPLPTSTPLILKGAGATFPYPVYEKWFTNYRRENLNLEIAYDPVGSQAGVRRLLAGEVDFGASTRSAIRDLAPGDDGKYLFFPAVVGAVVPIVNLPGLAGEIVCTPGGAGWHLPRQDWLGGTTRY